MIVYKCNRCKKEVDPSLQKYDIYKKSCSFINMSEPISCSDEIVHLCPECTAAFDKFLEGEEVKSNIISNETLIGPMGGFHYADV